MKRREFLEVSAATLLLAGCGGGSEPEPVVPETLRVSRTDIIVGDVNGVLYRVRPNANSVSRIDASGNAIWTMASRGSGPGQFDFPSGIVTDVRGRVLVVDRGNDRVQILDGSTGAFLGAFGSPGDGPGQFRNARQIAVASDRIYVVDQLNDRVNVFDMNGNSLFAIGTFGTEPGQLNAPLGVAADAGGNVYVTDSTDDAIKRFSASGAFIGSVANPQVVHPHGIAIDAIGQLWVADGIANRVAVLTTQGALVRSLPTRISDGRPGAPHDIALSGRDIYVRALPNG